MFREMSDSYYKKNVLQFSKTMSQSDLNKTNSTIKYLKFINSYHLNIDDTLLDKHVFRNMTYLYLYSNINSIQTNLFGSFENLKEIYFHVNEFMNLVRRQGIDWMKSMNSDLSVNISDSKEVSKYSFRIKVIYLNLIN